MITKIVKVSAGVPDQSAIDEAAQILMRGGLVAFPTETVYGLGADALNAEAVKKVFSAKGRPPDNPLIVHIANFEQLEVLTTDIPPIARKLSEKFWPGPLSLVLWRSDSVPDVVTGGLQTVAVRMPNHPVVLALTKTLRGGIVGPSANASGRPSPTTAEHVYNDLSGKIELILDAGPTSIGIESTVVDVTTDPPTLLRPGGLAREFIAGAVGALRITADEKLMKRSPGTRYRHYAPTARVVIVEMGDRDAFVKSVETFQKDGKRVGCIIHSLDVNGIDEGVFVRRLPGDTAAFGREIFRSLRDMDDKQVEVILVEGVEEKGLGEAIMDRLRRAAGSKML